MSGIQVLGATIFAPTTAGPSLADVDPFITGESYWGLGIETLRASGSFGAFTWPNANDAIACPVVMPTTTLRQAVYRGTNATGNIDVGLYDSDWNLVVSTGSFANAANVITVDIADTDVEAGYYYIATAANNTSSGVHGGTSGSVRVRAVGVVLMPNAFPLPSVFVPEAQPGASFAVSGFSTRSIIIV